MKGHWTLGKRRNALNGTCLRGFPARTLAQAIGVSDRTIRRWQSGEDYTTEAMILAALNHIVPNGGGSLPLYSTEMAIDGHTRVGGVGDYSRRMARGCVHERLEPLTNMSWEEMARLEDGLCSD